MAIYPDFQEIVLLHREIYVHLRAEMKNLLKYLLPIVMIVAFSNAAGGFESSPQKAVPHNSPTEDVELSGSFSTPNSELGVPGQVSLSCPIRVLSQA